MNDISGANVASPLPRTMPVYRTRIASDYRVGISRDTRTRVMADQLHSYGKMQRLVVAIPVLATDDGHLIPHALNEYLKQAESYPVFTLVLYPNASLVSDPGQKAVSECVDVINEFRESNPTLDVRAVQDQAPPSEYSTIGAIRKLLWDAIALASNESLTKPSTETLQRLMAMDEGPVEIQLPELSQHIVEPRCLNHDIDVVSMPENFIRETDAGMILEILSSPGSESFSFTSRHASDPKRPNLSSAIAIHDSIIAASGNGFEAGIGFLLESYCSFGGFNENAKTYEVASACRYMEHSHLRLRPMKTSPRRLLQRLQSVEFDNVWENPYRSSEENAKSEGTFGDSDACRNVALVDGLPDITRERLEELTKAHVSDDDLQAVITNKLVHQVYVKEESDAINLYRLRRGISVELIPESFLARMGPMTSFDTRVMEREILVHHIEQRVRILTRWLVGTGFYSEAEIRERLMRIGGKVEMTVVN